MFRFWILLEHPSKIQTHLIAESQTISESPSVSSKLTYIPSLLKYMIPLGLVYFFEYLINQGLVSIYSTVKILFL